MPIPSIDPAIRSAIEDLDRLGRTRNDAWQVGREEGQMLYQLARISGARLIIEIGTSYGFSGLWWAAALKPAGGHLHTIDVDPKKFESSKATFAAAGVGKVITNHLGNARDVLRGIDGPYDLVFIDADKPSCRAYLDLVWPKLLPGGSVLTDNIGTHREELADFVKYARSLPDAASMELTVGNGVEWTVKTR
jgi:predicted O-methyltransferase YrrM